MNRLIVILLLIAPNFLFATNYVNEFPTYLYGDIRPIAAIYNAIAMISSDTIYNTIISIAVLYSIFNIGFLVITKADLVSALKSGSFTIGALSVLLVPVDVHLVDKRLDKGLISNYYDDSVLGYEKISNVPWLVAITPSVATTISSDLIELVDSVFKGNTINYSGMKDIGKVGFADIGFGNAYESINKIVENYSFDELGTTDALNFKSDFKSYLSECVLPMSVTNKKVSANLLAPTKDIYSALAPAEIGVDATYSITRRDGTSTDCVSFYNNEIKTNVASLTVDTNAKISKLVGVPDVLALKGLDRIALANIQSDVFATSTAQLTIYAQNLAAAPLVQSLFENYYRGTSISGQDIANNITGSKSTAAIQTQGLGQFKWMSQILPYALHFLFGIILAASILTIIMAMARGLYQGSAVARNYFAGFIQFESIRVSLALVNNLVLYYSVIDAADKLTAFGGNPIAITRIPSYLNYIATMEGISGILGISAIFIIPMIALKGDVTSAASAMQSLSGRYQGNDIENATDAISKSSAREKALATNEEAITAKLSKMGLSVPPGRAPLDYYNAVTNDLSKMNAGVGNMINQDKMDNFSKGVVAKTTSDISNTAGFGSTANLDSISRVSQQDGQVMGNTTNFTDSMRSSTGWDGSKVARGRALEGVGKDISTMGASDSVQNGDLEQYAKGSSNQGKMNMAKTLGSGLVNLSNKDLEDLQYGSKAGIDSEVGKARGVRKNYDQNGEDAYKTTSEYGERSNMSKTMAKLNAQGGMEGAISIDTKDSSFKASQQKGAVEGTEETANKIRHAGESIGDALSRISKELTSGKLASDSATIDYANANGRYVNFQKKSALEKISSAITTLDGKTGSMIDESGVLTAEGKKTIKEMTEGKAKSDIRTVAEYDKQLGDGGYVQAQIDNASIRAGQDIGTLKAQRKEKFIDNNGLTEKGIDSYGITPTEQAESLSAKYDTFYGKNAQKSANNVVSGLKEIASRDATIEATALAKEQKLNKEDSKKFIDDYVKNKLNEVDNKLKELGMIDSQSVPQTGDAMVGALAKMGSMNYASSKSLSFDGKNITLGIDSSTGESKIFNSNSGSDVKTGQNNTYSKLNSSTVGNKNERNEDYDVNNKGDYLNYDMVINMLGNGTLGEIAKDVLQGVGVFAALDAVSGGRVKQGWKNAKDKYREYRNKKTGNVHGKGDDGKERNFNPNSRNDVDEYLDNNKGAKSRLNQENLSREHLSGSSGREPSGPKYPHNDATTNPTTYMNNAESTADAIADSSKINNSNYSTKVDGMPHETKEHPKITGFATEAEATAAGLNTKGIFRQRFDAVQNALHSGSNWKTKMGLTASALILGSQSETFANALNAVDPLQLVMGPDLGKDSDKIDAQNSISPKMVQSQLNAIPDSMRLMGSNNAQSSILNQIYNKYQSNLNALNQHSMSQDEFDNNNLQLNKLSKNVMNNAPISQNSMEYAGLNTQNMSFNNGNLDMQKLQMMEMASSINDIQESIKLSDVQITQEDLESIQKELKRLRRR